MKIDQTLMEATKILHSSGDSSSSDHNGSWSSETTWAIASGSLKNAVTFDTSYDSPDESESDSSLKSPPLILNPPAPEDSGPCEIKLYFLHKYNIRQIYVRSTACVYEVYCAQSQSSGSEYLCTVRCSIAERDEKVLQAVYVEQLSEERAKHGAVKLPDEKFSGEENNSPSEDDWVEVKVFDSPVLENEDGSLSNKTNFNTGKHIQDYYEATVEISDSDPCTSLTIRLLSLQNKGVVYIDEVYVFAELVDSIDPENQATTVNGSAGSSLMAMFVPTLLQMSKSCVSPVQLGRGNKVESLSKSTELNISADFCQSEELTADLQCMKLQDINVSRVESIKSELPNQNANGDRSHDPAIENDSKNANGDRSHDPVNKNDSPYGHIERILEQLVSRVSKIEEVCLRFEENMLKPIKCMETRIQQVEQQLESLAKTSQYFGLPPGIRISAPSFTCESNSSSFHNDGSDCQPCRGPDLERKEFTSDSLANTSDGMSNSVNAPRLLPSLVVTAPEFSCGDDEQDDDALESFNEINQDDVVSKPLKDSPQERKNIDDILAAALSRFLSSTSDHPSTCEQTSMFGSDTKITSNKVPSENFQILPSKAHEVTTHIKASEEPPMYTQILTVRAPEFTPEENGADNDSNCTEFPSTEAFNFANMKSDDKHGVPSCGDENIVSPVASDLSDCNGNKSACDSLSIPKNVVPTGHVIPNILVPDDTHSGESHVLDQSFEDSTICSSSGLTADQTKSSVNTDDHETIKETGQPSMVLSPKRNNVHSCGTDVQNHLSEENTTCSFLEQSVSLTADHAKNSERIDVCQPADKTDLRESTVVLSPEYKDILEQYFGSNAEGPVKDILQNVSNSATTLVDFRLPILDVNFASHENSSSQTPLEALLGDLQELKVEAKSVGKDGGDSDAAKETNILGTDDGETIDPLTSKRLLVDLGIYDIVVSSDEEGGLDDPCTTCKHEMVAGLI